MEMGWKIERNPIIRIRWVPANDNIAMKMWIRKRLAYLESIKESHKAHNNRSSRSTVCVDE